ncbi:TPA_asm: RNA-directed RNA polymerase [ssRNA phage Gephyllon.1_22]|uniref:RNA-directed RNA polymerase n=2 Tax=Fiersviridae TaxID=2842319 RepID=A0A8S5L441_9VIRU|nr:RNA-directed RNA polymerase [ssRNA phage Gephyllon.1_22]QDH89073.1 MAG: RNA-dependent RNA polymerase [Leviviridae sp.]DAD52101.1 TPA_asm: RNA-directed RNA polymerase [ssRNA phage Gephyllon.1_22]
MKTSKRKSLETPLNLYLEFRSLLREQLEVDATFKASYLLAEMESKLLDPLVADPPNVRRSRAIEKWLACEVTNRATNVRLMHMDETDVLFTRNGFPVSAVDIANSAAWYIRQTIGDVPPATLRGSFSGGASTSLKRSIGTVARKYLEGTDITEGAIMHFLPLTMSSVWAPRDFRLVRGNVMFTVPKSSSIDRCACKEPEFNMYAQKAVGDSIRRSLMRVGINLNDQTVNQRLAREGSIQGNLATVDLSSASDSVTTQLVLRLVPDEWFHLMADLRSPETRIDGDWHLNEMFSSMGNGFTFELESLIFWAITRAVAYHSETKGRISVYGDDIICPSGLNGILGDTLEFFGFKVNPKKSFFEGSFRESCGKHWFAGLDVTPFYVKKVPVDVSDWCHLLNSLRRWSAFGTIADPDYYTIWSLFSEFVPLPLHGGTDLDRIDYLVSPGRSPIALARRRKRRLEAIERELSSGCYLHWMDVTSDRNSISEVVTSTFSSEGVLELQRTKREPRKTIPTYPQEHGLV